MNKIPDLNEITFQGRNKDYGAYQIRKKYRKYLIFSMAAAVFIFLLMVFIPWAIYFLKPDTVTDMDENFAVEYSFIPPPEDMPLNFEGSPPPPAPAEQTPAPVVVDTVIKQVQKKEEPKVEEPSADSAKDTGSSGNGEGDAGDGKIYTTLDVYPRFPGGDQARINFLRQNIRYPQGAMKDMIQGVVKIVFVVEPDGSLSRFEVVKGIGGGCDEEALRVVKLMPRWEPGRRNGQTVRVLISMPIVFRLPRKP